MHNTMVEIVLRKYSQEKSMAQQSEMIMQAARDGMSRKMSMKQTFLNSIYLLLAFFLGITYFALLVTGLAVGFGTLIIWLGVPILFGTMLLWWQLAAFERWLAIKMLGVTIAPMTAGRPRRKSLWQGFQGRVSNPMTWKILAFLLLKLPVGGCCFGIALALPIVSFGLTLVS